MEPASNETPTKLDKGEYQLRKTPMSTPKSSTSLARFVLLSNNSSFTPSPSSLAKRQSVRNPFENQFHERLHLPVISSPSLFQERPTEKFQWNIDELSNLVPVNFVPHDTQFQENLDPVREAQAQAAIHSFFTEQIIVPSPQDCSLRNHKIIFKNDDACSKIVNSTAMGACGNDGAASMDENEAARTQTREAATQTTLTFPRDLPKEVEDCLKKYKIFNEEDNDDDTLNSTANCSVIDLSTLRRKLFINPHPETPEFQQCYVDLSPAPRTPQLKATNGYGIDERMNNSFGNDMFGELSPIESENCSSFNDISMLSEKNQTPSGRKSRLKPITRGKNLSESFNLYSEEARFEDGNEIPKRFGRFDSGFSGDEDSKFAIVLNSHEHMQF